MARGSVPDRFWSKVSVQGEYDCWVWSRSTNPDGYGRFACRNSVFLAHRVAYELSFGRVPPGSKVLHKCDNPPCCNPKHLFLGDQLANMTDCKAKGRNPVGSGSGRSKLTEDQVTAIRRDHSLSGGTYESLAQKWGVTDRMISNIVRRKNWTHVR